MIYVLSVPQTLVCFTFIHMIYGFVFFGHLSHAVQKQRRCISAFAKQHKQNIDKFVVFDKNPDISMLKPGDVVICYSWECLCSERAFLRQMIQYLMEHRIYLYSATSKYCIDKAMNWDGLGYGFGMYDDMLNTFASYKSIRGVKTRVANGHAPGRRVGAKNLTHVLDGKEQIVLDMHNSGVSMYAIAKKLRVSAPTIRRFLIAHN